MVRKAIFIVLGVVCFAVAGALLALRKPVDSTAAPRPPEAKVALAEPLRAAQAPIQEAAAGKKEIAGTVAEKQIAEKQIVEKQIVEKPMEAKAAPKVYAAAAESPAHAAKMAQSPRASVRLNSGSASVGNLFGSGGAMASSGVGSAGLGTIGIGGIGTKGGGGGGGVGAMGSSGLGVLGGGGSYGRGGGMAARSTTSLSVSTGDVSRKVKIVAPIEVTSNAEGYHNYGINPYVDTKKDRLSTFSVDVDTASYTIARKKLMEGQLPPKDSVRVEEFLNYFHYSYPAPVSHPLAVYMDAAPSPFTPGHHLLRVGVQGKKLSVSERKPAHLTFLVDVSGSMAAPDKLPLAKRSLRLLVDNLKDGDTVAIVTYASGTRVVLPPTDLEGRVRILSAIDELQAGGSTSMAGGIEQAYKLAMRTLDGKSNSRVLILSDGDANVGTVSHEEILKMIRGYVKEGVTLSTFGFGMGNYKDQMMEQLADRGNGNYFYVDSLMQARRIFQEQIGGTLEVIAKDVKLQVELDPAQVKRYRLVGYENRDIADEDFRNDKVDAGEIGAGHTVTALYELELADDATGQGLATVRIRAKKPRGETADEVAYDFPEKALSRRFEDASADFQFATAVMAAAEIFRQSPHASEWSYDKVLHIARGATPQGNAEREEFVALLEHARSIVGRVAAR